jgi:hypothetical protein
MALELRRMVVFIVSFGWCRLTAAQSPRPPRLARKSVNFICVIQREKLDGRARLTARKGGKAGKFFRQVYFRGMRLFC